MQRTFQVEDTSSGFVGGIASNENYTLDNIAAYVQDNWRWKPNFTVRAGLKWEYYSPLKEDDNLGFLPILNGRSLEQTMLDPATELTFVDGDIYNKDLNNFGPTLGFAWDVTKDGKTAVRGGYSLTFVNEETVTVGRAASRGNTGLSSAASSATSSLASTPAYQRSRRRRSSRPVRWRIRWRSAPPACCGASIPSSRRRTCTRSASASSASWARSTAVEARYVGTFGRDIWRGTDYNQVQISPEFLADFNRARSNGYLAQQAGLAVQTARSMPPCPAASP